MNQAIPYEKPSRQDRRQKRTWKRQQPKPRRASVQTSADSGVLL